MKTKSFKNARIVVTGGSSGLGLALAHALAKKGARLVLVARNPSKLDAAAREIVESHPGAKVDVQAVDVTDEAAVTGAMRAAAEAMGGIDVLINNAGILREGYFETLPSSAFRDVMDINFFGVLNATMAALPYLKEAKGRLINIASVAGLMGVFGYTPYCASKHALVGFTSSLRCELEPLGVKVQLVCPGEFDSPMVDELDQDPDAREPRARAHDPESHGRCHCRRHHGWPGDRSLYDRSRPHDARRHLADPHGAWPYPAAGRSRSREGLSRPGDRLTPEIRITGVPSFRFTIPRTRWESGADGRDARVEGATGAFRYRLADDYQREKAMFVGCVELRGARCRI